jgi:WD40 repeat protein
MEDQLPTPPKRGLDDDYIRLDTPERPPQSPISLQQSPRYRPDDRPVPRSYPDSEEEHSLRQVNEALSYLKAATLNRLDASRSPSVDRDSLHQRSMTPEQLQVQTPELAPEPVSQVQYKPTLVLKGHRNAVSQVKFSPDGKWIASCCEFAFGLGKWSGLLLTNAVKLPTLQSRSGTPKQAGMNTLWRVIWPVSPRSRGAQTRYSWPLAPTTRRYDYGTQTL